MEWLNAPLSAENMEVDIGYMPQMELRATQSSTDPPTEVGQDRSTVYLEHISQPEVVVDWEVQISREEAMKRLEVQFYQFKQVGHWKYSNCCILILLVPSV